MSSGGTNTSTTTSGPPAQFLDAYSGAVQNAQNVASTPYSQYSGNLVAPLSPDQTSGISEVENAQGIANPYINAGAQDINAATTPLWGETQQFSPSNVQQYESPYTSQVLGTTEASEANTDAQQQEQLQGNAASSGAWGGDRASVAQGILGGQQALANNQTNAGIENQGYTQAVGEFNTQQQAQLGANEANSWLNSQAGYGMANLGQEAENTELGGASALLSTGGLEQTQAQSELNVPYEEFTAQEAYPFQTAGWEANIAEGLGSAAGGTSSTSQTPSAASEAAGLGIAGIGAAGLANKAGLFGSSSGDSAGAFYDPVGTSSALGVADSGAADSPELGAQLLGEARGGRITNHTNGGFHRAPGGLVPISGIPNVAVGGSPMPSVGISFGPTAGEGVVPEGSGGGSMGGLLDTSTGSTTTTTGGGGASPLVQLLQGAGEVAAGIWGGPAGAAAAGALSSAVDSARGGAIPHRDSGGSVSSSTTPSTSDLADILDLNAINTLDTTMAKGGIVLPFPKAHRGGIGIVANDDRDWPEPRRAAGGIAVAPLPTPNPGVTTFAGNNGVKVPQLATGTGVASAPAVSSSTAGGGINVSTGQGASNTGSPALDNYLNSVEAGASFKAPTIGAPPAAASSATPAAASGPPQTNDGSDWFSSNIVVPSGNGGARGGRIGRADGGDLGPDGLPDDNADLPELPEATGIAAVAPPMTNAVPGPGNVGIAGPPPSSSGIAGSSPRGRGRQEGPDPADEIKAPMGADPYKALLYTGLGIMGGGSGNAFENIGRGALAGLKEYTSEDEAAKRLSTAADEARARLKETEAWHQATSGNQSQRIQNTADYQAGSLAVRNRAADLRGQGMDETAAWHHANEELGQGKLAIAQQNADTGMGRLGVSQQNADTSASRATTSAAQGWAAQAQKMKQAEDLVEYRRLQATDREAAEAFRQAHGLTQEQIQQRNQDITIRGQLPSTTPAPERVPPTQVPGTQQQPTQQQQGAPPIDPASKQPWGFGATLQDGSKAYSHDGKTWFNVNGSPLGQ